MWTRAQLKSNAKLALTNKYWMAFLVTLVVTFLFGSSGSGSAGLTYNLNYSDSYQSFSGLQDQLSNYLFILLPVILFSFVFALAFGLAISAFLTGPIMVGHNRYYMENRFSKPTFGRLFYAFSSNYMKVVKTVFLKNLFISLWSLLFIVPGVIKHYEYYMVDYIMAENPNIEWRRALELSKQMTNGEKWNIFVLELSFIGWFLLGAMACGIGVVFVNPYHYATFAELYEAMREKALSYGFASGDELPGFLPPPAPTPNA